MTKIVKGGRFRLKRSDVSNVSPTIPPNNDHTTGWLDTDIYTGELFANVNSSTPGIWFRDNGGMTQMATLDKITKKVPYSQLPAFLTPETKYYSYSFSGNTYSDTVSGDTQYIVVSGTSAIGINIYNLILSGLENSVKTLFISLNLIYGGGTSLTVNIKNGLGNNVLTYNITNSNMLRGINLMWNGNTWVIISNTLN
jgi:hypothetical protein